jgi:hypothetical protein
VLVPAEDLRNVAARRACVHALLVRCVAPIAVAGFLSGQLLAPAAAGRSPFREIAVARTLVLPPGHVTRSFGFTIHGDYADVVVLDVPKGAVMSLRALPLNGMQIVGTTTRAGGGVCGRRGSRVVCIQGLEWCGLVQGRWRATVRKMSQAAALIRVRLVFVRRTPASRRRSV